MKNSIWVGKNSQGIVIASFVKPILSENGLFTSCGSTKYYTHCECNVFGLALEEGEIVEVIHNTKTNEIVVKREREVGWYLTKDSSNLVIARHWGGKNWCSNRKSRNDELTDEVITVVSAIIKDNEYLRGLE